MHLWTLNALGKKEIALSRIVVRNKAWETYIYLRNRPKGDRINSARLLLKSGSRKGRDLSWPHFQIIFVSRRENLRYLMRIFFYICFFCFRLQSWCLLSPLNVSDLTHSQKSLFDRAYNFMKNKCNFIKKKKKNVYLYKLFSLKVMKSLLLNDEMIFEIKK